ncbi:MAG: hypothetical protein Q7T33_07720 [Dehalococcoidia bacterium]|nr:hypothetical protein [Dehalococcoidia bacterium]
MPKQKQARRRRRERAARREPAAAVAQAVAPEGPRLPRDVSWTGLIGGVMGLLFLGQAAVYILVSPGDNSRWLALPLLAMAAIYLPAIWASAVQTARRRQVQRAVIVVTLVIVVAGVVLVGPAFATLLLVPSTLLAIASGLVFQGGTRRK